MTRKGYPFSKRDSNFGLNIIASLFAIPIASFFSILSQPINTSSDGGFSRDLKPRVFDFQEEKKVYRILGIVRLILPIIGMLIELLDWWIFSLMPYYIFFSIFDFLLSPSNFRHNVEHLYIFDKKRLTEHKAECDNLLELNIRLSIISCILYWYPILYYLLNVWDGGLTVRFNIVIVVLMQVVRGLLLYKLFYDRKHLYGALYKNQLYLKEQE